MGMPSDREISALKEKVEEKKSEKMQVESDLKSKNERIEEINKEMVKAETSPDTIERDIQNLEKVIIGYVENLTKGINAIEGGN